MALAMTSARLQLTDVDNCCGTTPRVKAKVNLSAVGDQEILLDHSLM